MSMFARFNLKRAFAWLGLAGMVFLQSAPAALAIDSLSVTNTDSGAMDGTYDYYGQTSQSHNIWNDNNGHTIWYGSGPNSSGWVLATIAADSVTVTDGLFPGPANDWYKFVTADYDSPVGTYLPRGGLPPSNYVLHPDVAIYSAPAPEFQTWVQMITIGLGLGMMWKFMPKLKMGMSAQ